MPTIDGSVPYPWPYDGQLKGTSIALLVTGAHRLWRDRSHDVDSVMASLGRLSLAVRSAGGLVVAVRHCGPARGRRPSLLTDGCGAGGTLFADYLGEPTEVIDAAGLNGFHGSSLDERLRIDGRTHLLFGGFGSEITVDSTLRSANDRGYECLTITDACAPIDPDLKTRALHSVTMSGGIFGAVGTTAATIAALKQQPDLTRHPDLTRNPALVGGPS